MSSIGQLPISHFSHTAVPTEATADAVRRKGPHDRVYAVMKFSGRDTVQQGDREAASRTGDFVVLDARPSVIQTETGGALVLDLPRERFEAVLVRPGCSVSSRSERSSPPRSWRTHTSGT
ncbi:hypothetical protein [Methylobacterium sp. 22177]|uniref:hypothetical protein n=1 Tax=Methylobacterium sp. 22177 TaxID=3453885 RepID=UPI003F8638D5